ncbi:MAG: cupin domain-containing protein [Methanomicrobiales archaeon]|nr:cupin domain-containing protein [Methanomicrobiales archaeon]
MYTKTCEFGYALSSPGIRRKTLVHGEKTLMAEFLLEKGAALPNHRHPQEQTGYLVSGHMILTIGDEVHEIRPGDSWMIPGNIEHHAKILDDSVAIEVFAPRRDDYLP